MNTPYLYCNLTSKERHEYDVYRIATPPEFWLSVNQWFRLKRHYDYLETQAIAREAKNNTKGRVLSSAGNKHT